MSYYAGDYYRGDAWSNIGRAVKKGIRDIGKQTVRSVRDVGKIAPLAALVVPGAQGLALSAAAAIAGKAGGIIGAAKRVAAYREAIRSVAPSPRKVPQEIVNDLTGYDEGARATPYDAGPGGMPVTYAAPPPGPAYDTGASPVYSSMGGVFALPNMMNPYASGWTGPSTDTGQAKRKGYRRRKAKARKRTKARTKKRTTTRRRTAKRRSKRKR